MNKCCFSFLTIPSEPSCNALSNAHTLALFRDPSLFLLFLSLLKTQSQNENFFVCFSPKSFCEGKAEKSFFSLVFAFCFVFFSRTKIPSAKITKIVLLILSCCVLLKVRRLTNGKQACSLVPWASSSLKTPLSSPDYGLQEHI